jgi:hypothetical protein
VNLYVVEYQWGVAQGADDGVEYRVVARSLYGALAAADKMFRDEKVTDAPDADVCRVERLDRVDGLAESL